MFDSELNSAELALRRNLNGTRHYGPETIVEHRAPTADSARLLSELEEAAIKRILTSFKLDNKVIGGAVQVMLDPLHDDLHIYVVARVNGSRIESKTTVTLFKINDAQEVFAQVKTDFADKLAASLLNDLFTQNEYRQIASSIARSSI